MSEEIPLSYRYQQSLAPLTKLAEGKEQGAVSKRLSELLTLLDFSTTLNRSLALAETLDIVLFVAMGETRASWAGIALKGIDGSFQSAARRGAGDPDWPGQVYPADALERFEMVVGREDIDILDSTRELLASMGAELAVPLRKGGDLIGLLLLGPSFVSSSGEKQAEGFSSFTEGERSFAEALSISASACIDNGRVYEELRDLNRRLSLKVYQLNSLFDITDELYRSRDAGAVREVLVASAMGQLLASRCALIQTDGAVRARGVKLTPDELLLLRTSIKSLDSLSEDLEVASFEQGPLRDLFERRQFERIVPLRSGAVFQGVLLIGRKASGKPVNKEDLDFLRSLAAQGAASLENMRLTQEWVEKQKIEKELAVARQIQRGLLPEQDPELPGWDIAGINIPSLAVGGDYYDYLPGPEGRIGLAIMDVSGKGTGPALIMANVQASLRALSSLSELALDEMLIRMNDHIFQSTEASKYVTAFFGWLDPSRAHLVYANAGHCYPLIFRRNGEVDRLIVGGPVIGLLPEIPLEIGETSFEPGDMLVSYTDGLSETQSPTGEEYQEERIIETVREVEDKPAREVIAKLVASARIFAAGKGLGDDLTLVVVKRL
jgi:sigma-B regulation protein RsbU (phosphoserine phosphatase)